MTDEEFNEKYSEVEVKFLSYYKYVFTFQGEGPNGEVVICRSGGCPDNIYRFEVNWDTKDKVRHYDWWNEVLVLKDGQQIYSFYNY